MIELLAAIPSIIYGIWGLFVFAPFVQQYIQPAIINTLGNVPGIGALFAGPPLGIGVLTAGIILAVMVLPFISSIMRDVFETVPPMLKESAYGLGATRGEVVRSVVLPYTRIGVVGGIMLGLGRALGETMAVTFVIGNAHRISASILQPGTTISAALANEFTEADQRHLPVVADRAGLHPVHHHLYRAGDRQDDAVAAAKAGGELIRWGSMPVAGWPTRVVMSLSVVATAFGLLWLVLVLWTLLVEGISAITPALFTQMTPPPGNSGGLLNRNFRQPGDDRRSRP